MADELKELGLQVAHRRVGRLMSENGIEVKRDLAIRTLEMATALRRPPKVCIHHSDSQAKLLGADTRGLGQTVA